MKMTVIGVISIIGILTLIGLNRTRIEQIDNERDQEIISLKKEIEAIWKELKK